MQRAKCHASGPISLVVAGVATLGLTSCSEAPQPSDNIAAAATGNVTAKTPLPVPVPVPLPILRRGDLIAAAAAAADAAAAGTALPSANRALVGRRFEVRLPFGCEGPMPAGEAAWAGWSMDPDTRALKLTARNEMSAEDPWLRGIVGGTAFEAAEGFWIRRPWTSAEACPAHGGAIPVAADAETLAVVEFFPPDASRTRQRRDRPYAATIKPDAQAAPTPRYRLLLEGRVAGFADRQPVHCLQVAPAIRPRCAIAVTFTRVAFEDETDGNIPAEWRF